ncbi:butyryl-CoA dehydrogenase [Thermosyntropha lipolytica DSM 11003]|uniref:Butyryl-CoA dehydrogenase n=1 Tax=Thermosyntropha lipolytica DSM 11003 TaxID=1123382 RepID=A0A1M5NEN4_9FIRM|nr:acyl-CoA dehydrogenase family protein [Thermosyntropha lipolytica]SHG87917.1 butyryl-CoA dehydrogenase [Thermosyntropha lipolytica DSM 11003]
MDFRLTEEQEMMKRMAREFADNEIAPYAQEWDKNNIFPEETVKKMHELGLMTIGVPAEYGGPGLDHVAQNIVTEEIARGDAGIATTMAASTLLAADPVLIAGTHEQKKWFYGMQNEGAIAAFCLTEPEAGSDVANLSTRCIKDGDYYILNGTKQFISNGGVAQLYVVFATLDKKLGHKGICAFMVDRNTPGVSVGPKEDKLGIRSSNTTQVIFEDVRVPAKNLLGKEGEGFKIAMKTLDLSRASVAAMAVGVAQAAMEASIKYAKERKQFGKPIASFQAIQFMLADMAQYIHAARLLYLEASSRQDMGLPFTQIASLAKCFAGDVAMKVATDAVQIFGGYGYTKEYPVEKYFRDAKIMQIFEGTAQVQRLVIARDLLRD